MRLRTLTAFILFLMSTQLFAGEQDQGGFTGLDLMHACQSAITAADNQVSNVPTTNQQFLQSLMCYSFIGGVVQGYMATFAFTYGVPYPDQIKDKAVRERMICLPDGVNSPTIEQLTRIVLRDLKNDPDHLNVRAGILVYASLKKVFPCN
jgi:hypothetical protein